MNSTILEDDDSDEGGTIQKKNSISLAKVKNIEPKLKRAKIDTWTLKPEITENCKYCQKMIHEKTPAFQHQRHCFQNISRVPLKCQKCHEDFEFVVNLRDHNMRVHRER
jgi:hypothetical protein